MTETPKVLASSNVRFDISNEGWKRMNAGRSAAELIREAVANSFDVDGATEVRVTLMPGVVSIEDNSPSGVGDPSLITTVFMTGKEDSPKKRGRKGRGLKELICAADKATVDTVGHMVIFEEGRQTLTSDRTSGTKVTVHVPTWDQAAIDEAKVYLLRIIPPSDIALFINDAKVPEHHIRTVFSDNLETQVVKDGIQKNDYAMTDVHLVELLKGEEAWIYEMGIPVQQIDTDFHIDIQQRVPLNDSRNSVSQWWLDTLYGKVLNRTIDLLDTAALKQKWVTRALGYTWDKDTQAKYVYKVYGDPNKLARKGHNKFANDVAKQHGYTIIESDKLPHDLEAIVNAVVKSTELVAKEIDLLAVDTAVSQQVADPNGRLTALCKFLSLQLISERIDVQFFERDVDFTGKMRLADFNPATKVLRFNVKSGLPMSNPIHPKMLSLICHEFAHNKFIDHDQDFTAEVQELAGQMAALMLTRREDVFVVAGVQVVEPSKGKIVINCEDCGAPREIFPQDAHQVTRCLSCTKRARTARAKTRRVAGGV